MKRSKELLEKRKEFDNKYVEENQKKDKQMKVIVSELVDTLFLTERTIYNILSTEDKIKFTNSKKND